jgi:hypothetical protein
MENLVLKIFDFFVVFPRMLSDYEEARASRIIENFVE